MTDTGRPNEEPGPEKRIRELSQDPGAPSLQALTQFVSAVHVRLYGVARERDRPLDERCGAIATLGNEARAAGPADPKGVRPQLRELLLSLRGREDADLCPDSQAVCDAVDAALEGW